MNNKLHPQERVTLETHPQSAQLPAYPMGQALAVQPMPEPVAQKETAWSLPNLLGVLRRRWFLTMVLGLPVALGAAYGAWMLIPAPYTAVSEVRVHSHVVTAPGRNQVGPKHKDLKQTHMQLVKDRRVIEAALLAKGIANLKMLREQEDPVQFLEKELKVSNRGTEFFRVSLTGTNPSELSKILNAITDAYESEVVVKDRLTLDLRVKLYEKLRDDAQESLSRKRNAMRTIIDAAAPDKEQLTEKQKSLLEYRLGLLKRIDELDIKVFKLEVLLTHRRKNAGKVDQTPISETILNDHLAADPKYRTLKNDVKVAEDRLKYNEKSLTANHPRVNAAQEDVAKAKAELEKYRKQRLPEIRSKLLTGLKDRAKLTDAQLQEEVAFQKTTRDALKKKLEEADGDGVKIGKKAIKLHDLEDHKKSIERQENFVQSLVAIIDQLKATQTLRDQDPQIELWRKASPPTVPNRKKKFMGTALAGVGGFGLVLLVIAFVDIRSRRINTVQQVVDRVGIPVLGTVPLIPRSASSRRNGRWAGKARYWHGVLTESIDAARTLLLRDAVGPMQVYMVASAASGEGKTTMACHLATSLARAGNHVLLVDGDLRRPFVHRTFDVESGAGLSEVLRGEAKLEEVIQPSGIARLPILPAGIVDQLALTKLAQGELAGHIEQWREKFDYIVIDSSPILPVTDGLLIAQHVDGVLFTVRRDVSRVSKVVTACERLSMLGVPLLGAVAIGLDHDGYAYHAYHGYQAGDTNN